MEEELSLVELFEILKKRMGLIVNTILLGILITAIYTFFVATPQYSSTTDLLVNRSQPEQTNMIEGSEIDTNLQLINTYSDIITRPVILDDVRDELEMDIPSSLLADQINITNENDSQMFSITVTDDNPYDAATIANTTALVFQETVPELLSVDNVAILSTAEPVLAPVAPNNILNLIIGVVLGGMLGVGIAFIIEFMDNTVKDDKFIIEEVGWTSLGRVSEMTTEELASNGRQDAFTRSNEEPNDTRSARTRV